MSGALGPAAHRVVCGGVHDAVIGAWLDTTQNSGDRLRLRWLDGAALLVGVLIVRLMVRGIPFVP